MGRGTEYFSKADTQTARRHEKLLSITNHQEMQIKTTVRYCLTLIRRTIIRKTGDICWKDVQKRKASCCIGGVVSWCIHYMENSVEGPWKIKNRTAIWSSNFTSGHLPPKAPKTLVLKDICTLAHICSIIIIANPSVHP